MATYAPIVDFIVLPTELSRLLAGIPVICTNAKPETTTFAVNVNCTSYPIHTEQVVAFSDENEAKQFAAMFCTGMACETRRLPEHRSPQALWYLWSSLHDAVMTYDPSDILNRRCFTFRRINIVVGRM